MTREQFVEKILENGKGSFLESLTILPASEYTNGCDTPLIKILNLNPSKISEEGMLVLDILENDEDFPYRSNYQQLKFNLLALCSVQDIFTGTFYNDYTIEAFAAQNYFYYEGLSLIREYFYAGFNNLLKASDHLVRTILEFNIRHCYFYWKCEETHSSKPIIEYLKYGICPSNQVMINKFLPKDSFCKPIKSKIQNLIQSLSSSSSHAFNPEHSIRSNGKMHFEYTIDSLLFWLNLNRILSAVLWSYYVSYPMLLHPKDIIRKCGYNPPLGLFCSHSHFMIFKNTLDSADLESFVAYTANQQIVKDLNDYYDSLAMLSDEEIKATWNKDEVPYPEDHFGGLAMITANMRATREVLANRCTMVEDSGTDQFPNILVNYSKYSFWKENYTKFR
jgi:hypothetical protein